MLKVLSLFDGTSGANQALERLGITDYQYFASEIDKYAISVTQKNFPNTIQIGSVTDIKGEDYGQIDLLCAGSPCQGFSFAGKQLNFEDERSKLFFEYVRILKEVKPRYFMLENVKMKKEFSDIITEQLFGITFTEINSSLLSGQNRKRLYWVGERQEDGTYKKVEILQPEDKKIFLKDILEENVDEKYNISNKHTETILSSMLTKSKTSDIHQLNNPTHSNNRIYGIDGKSPTLNTMQGGNRQPKILEDNTSYINYPLGSREFQGNGWKSDKSLTLLARDYKDPKVILENTNPLRIRKLTVLETERLQTMKDGYTAIGLVNGVEVPISNSQRYKMVGNGWTTSVIAHIFSHLNLTSF